MYLLLAEYLRISQNLRLTSQCSPHQGPGPTVLCWTVLASPPCVCSPAPASGSQPGGGCRDQEMRRRRGMGDRNGGRECKSPDDVTAAAACCSVLWLVGGVAVRASDGKSHEKPRSGDLPWHWPPAEPASLHTPTLPPHCRGHDLGDHGGPLGQHKHHHISQCLQK